MGGGGSSLTGKATKPMKIYTVLIFDTPDLNCPDIAASLF